MDKIDFPKSMFSLPHQLYSTTRPHCPNPTYLRLSTPPCKSSSLETACSTTGFEKVFS